MDQSQSREDKQLLNKSDGSFLPPIGAHKQTLIKGGSDSEDDELTFQQFVTAKQTGSKPQENKSVAQSQAAQKYENVESASTRKQKQNSGPASFKPQDSTIENQSQSPEQKAVTGREQFQFTGKNNQIEPDKGSAESRSSEMAQTHADLSQNGGTKKVHPLEDGDKLKSQRGPVMITPGQKDKPEDEADDKIFYKSRNDTKFEDHESMYESSDDGDHDDGLAKTSMPYLRKQSQLLQKEIDRTNAMMEVEQQKQALGANSDQDVKPNKRFKNFNDLFSGLTKSKNVPTGYSIVNCCITYNSRSAVTVTQKDDREYWVKQYSLETYGITFQEKIGGLPDSYIKLKEVEQNNAGNQFAITYIDDGIFKLRTFGETFRTPEEIEANELNINKELDINNYTMPINNFPDPFIACTFITDDLLFVNFFHNATLTHHHFFFNKETRAITGHTKVVLDCNNKNFPQKCYYNTDNNEIYTFYRQGQSFRIPVTEIESPKNDEKEKFYYQKIYDKDLGAMYLIYEQALVVRCSSQILFFKIVVDELNGDKKWELYHQIDLGGFIYYIRGNARIQLTTDQNIYFYVMDIQTLMPHLENVMNNFMNCSQMMFGSKVKYGITYKTNQKSFDIHRRKFEHDFKVNVRQADFDGSRGLTIESMNAFLVSRIATIQFFDIDTFQEIKDCEITIPLLVSKEREPNEIISMQISTSEQMLAVISGKNLIMNEQKPNQLFVFKRVKDFDPTKNDKFELIKRIVIREIPMFNKISMQFYFKNTKGDKDPTEMIFAKQDQLMQINLETEEIITIVKFIVPLTRQPEFFTMNDDQTVSIVASLEDGIFYNHKTQEFVDLDDTFEISSIKEIIYDHEDRMVYLLANKYQDKLGLFIIRFSELDPGNYNFFLKYKNKLDIADADIAVLRCKHSQLKELVVSYKTIHSNNYTVQVCDISRDTPWPLYKHESFQLWESQISAFFIEKNREYVMINRDGISVISLGAGLKRSIKDSNGQEKMIHPLESANYLKVDKDNFINFEFSGQKKVINILQQFVKKSAKTGNETAYDNVYKVRICDITLRELLLFQSLYVCSTQSDIFKLVKSQANPTVFYKSFLELDGTNMTSILSFDSRSMRYILSDEFAEYFNSEFPLFYKNKIAKSNNKDKFFYRSAIDSALRNNQISAIQIIIEYIVKYQNSFVSSFLFLNNFDQLIEKGVQMTGLVESDVFCFEFDFDEWPSTHTDCDTYYRPYNGSIFDIRTQYRTIFYEDQFKEQGEDEVQADTSRVFKIKYQINTLSQLSEYIEEDPVTGVRTIMNEEMSLLGLCSETDELSLFETNQLDQLITFKWDAFARKFHMIGCIAHFSYLTIMIIYVNAIYVNNDQANASLYGILLVVGIIYPMVYDLSQLYRTGPREYFKDPQNYSDQLYVWCSVINVISQNSSDSQAFRNKVVMTIIFLMQILKSFFYLRIFQSLSYIVTMIYTVVADLKVFLLFFTILVVLFAQIMAVIGVGNYNHDNQLKEYVDLIEAGLADGDIPMEEYDQIGLWAGTLVSTLRIAMGDFDFGASMFLTPEENMLYWLIWLMVVTMTCIIFLNFIIAEASASYEKVKENLVSMINKEKSSLIGEAEEMIPRRLKRNMQFPKYVIIREVEI